MTRYLKEIISELLKENSRGLSIVQLAILTELSTSKLSKALANLREEGKIEIVGKGSDKMHYWKGNNR